MAKTIAKFRCQSVEKIADYRREGEEQAFLYTAKLGAVTGDSEENKAFWKATPAGDITLRSILSDAFVPGKFYYVDFYEAEE